MQEHSSVYMLLNWTKERATSAAHQTRASQIKAESKIKADQLITDLKERRDEFSSRSHG